MSNCTQRIICESAMGLSESFTKEQHALLTHSIRRVMELMVERIIKIWLQPDFIFNRTQRGKKFYETVEYTHEITDKVIKMKKKEIKNDNKNIEENNSKRKIFLDLLMEMEGGKMTDKELRDEVTTIIIGGSDTTAITLSFCLYLLATHPEIQSKIYTELYEIYGEHSLEEQPIEYEDLAGMEYLEKVIKESLRLFPTAPIVMRKVAEDIVVGNHVFPKDAIIILVFDKIHRNEKFWPNPLEFDPDRFLLEEVAKRDAFTYLPFSAGLRGCIGQAYAIMSMKILIASILRCAIIKMDKIKPIKDMKVTFDVLARPVEPIMLRFVKRIPKHGFNKV